MGYSKKHLDAFAGRIQQYEQAILDIEKNGVGPDAVRRKWLEIDGILWNCHVCETTDFGAGNCTGCVIGRREAPVGCCDCCYYGQNMKTRSAMFKMRRKAVLCALKERRAWMLKQAKRNGIILVPAKKRIR